MSVNEDSTDKQFTTEDVALAAWLHSQGFELCDIESDKFPSTFIFDNGNPRLKEYARDFQCGRANGSILLFYNSYKMLIGKLKVARI